MPNIISHKVLIYRLHGQKFKSQLNIDKMIPKSIATVIRKKL